MICRVTTATYLDTDYTTVRNKKKQKRRYHTQNILIVYIGKAKSLFRRVFTQGVLTYSFPINFFLHNVAIFFLSILFNSFNRRVYTSFTCWFFCFLRMPISNLFDVCYAIYTKTTTRLREFIYTNVRLIFNLGFFFVVKRKWNCAAVESLLPSVNTSLDSYIESL